MDKKAKMLSELEELKMAEKDSSTPAEALDGIREAITNLQTKIDGYKERKSKAKAEPKEATKTATVKKPRGTGKPNPDFAKVQQIAKNLKAKDPSLKHTKAVSMAWAEVRGGAPAKTTKTAEKAPEKKAEPKKLDKLKVTAKPKETAKKAVVKKASEAPKKKNDLIEKVKRAKAKVKRVGKTYSYKQNGEVRTFQRDKKKDGLRTAKHVGKRVSKEGNVYYEYRDNRADVNIGKVSYKRPSLYAKGGETGKKYMVFNYTDNIYASPEVFNTKKEANEFIKSFRKRFEMQGYYRDNRMNKIDIEDIDLLAIPSDFSPFRKFAKGGTLDAYDQKAFKEWLDDGNVSKNPDGTYSTQDAQYQNRLESLTELKKYFKKEILEFAKGGAISTKPKYEKGELVSKPYYHTTEKTSYAPATEGYVVENKLGFYAKVYFSRALDSKYTSLEEALTASNKFYELAKNIKDKKEFQKLVESNYETWITEQMSKKPIEIDENKIQNYDFRGFKFENLNNTFGISNQEFRRIVVGVDMTGTDDYKIGSKIIEQFEKKYPSKFNSVMEYISSERSKSQNYSFLDNSKFAKGGKTKGKVVVKVRSYNYQNTLLMQKSFETERQAEKFADKIENYNDDGYVFSLCGYDSTGKKVVDIYDLSEYSKSDVKKEKGFADCTSWSLKMKVLDYRNVADYRNTVIYEFTGSFDACFRKFNLLDGEDLYADYKSSYAKGGSTDSGVSVEVRFKDSPNTLITTKSFDTKAKAEAFAKKINNAYKKNPVIDIYGYDSKGKMVVDFEDFSQIDEYDIEAYTEYYKPVKFKLKMYAQNHGKYVFDFYKKTLIYTFSGTYDQCVKKFESLYNKPVVAKVIESSFANGGEMDDENQRFDVNPNVTSTLANLQPYLDEYTMRKFGSKFPPETIFVEYYKRPDGTAQIEAVTLSNFTGSKSKRVTVDEIFETYARGGQMPKMTKMYKTTEEQIIS